MLFKPIKPMLPSKGKEAFDNPDFIFEPKWDGWRILLHKQGERLEAYTSYGLNITNKFPELPEAAAAITSHTAVMDCEGIVLREGRPVYDDFTYRCRLSNSTKIRTAVLTHPVTFVVFDLLYSDREHLKESLLTRKRLLGEIISATKAITPTMYLDGEGTSLFHLTGERNMEGIVAKRKTSVYIPDSRTADWIKINHVRTIDTIILGYRTAPFALVIGLNFRTVKNKPVGIVEDGFKPEDIELFLGLAEPLRMQKDQKTQWIQPSLCCRIGYLERSDTHQLTTTVFREFLLDKKPEDCLWIS